MSGPELPQPIYPTQSPPAGGAPPQVPGGPPSPQGPGGSPQQKKGTPQALVIGIAVAVLVVGGIVGALVLGGGGDDGDRAGGDEPRATTNETTRASTVQREEEPGGTASANGRGDDPGPDDAAAEAEAIVEVGFVDPTAGTRGCLVDALVADDGLRRELIGQVTADAFLLSDASMAQHYASTVMSCASPGEMLSELENVLVVSNSMSDTPMTEYQLSCIVAEASSWDSADWVDFLAMSVQPHRAAEVQQMFIESVQYC